MWIWIGAGVTFAIVLTSYIALATSSFWKQWYHWVYPVLWGLVIGGLVMFFAGAVLVPDSGLYAGLEANQQGNYSVAAAVPVGTIGLCMILAWIVWVYSYWGRGMSKVNQQTWYVSLLSVAAMLLPVWVSIMIPSQKPIWLILYLIFLSIAFGVMLYSTWKTRSEVDSEELISGQKSLIRKAWNWNKGLAGGTFSDFANGLGILAGVGAYQVQNPSPVWFWMGQFGAFLAIMIGLNLCVRWTREKDRIERILETEDATFYVFTKWTAAILSYLCGTVTFLALITTAAASIDASGTFQLADPLKSSLAFSIIFFSLMVVGCLVFIFRHWDPSFGFLGTTVLLSLITAVPLTYLVIYSIGSNAAITPEGWGTGYGIAATVLGVMLELASFWSLKTSFVSGSAFSIVKEKDSRHLETHLTDWKSPFRLVRGIYIILGNIALLVLVIAVGDTFEIWMWVVFSIAIAVLLEAAFMGIFLSNHDVAVKNAETTREHQQDLRLAKLTQEREEDLAEKVLAWRAAEKRWKEAVSKERMVRQLWLQKKNSALPSESRELALALANAANDVLRKEKIKNAAELALHEAEQNPSVEEKNLEAELWARD